MTHLPSYECFHCTLRISFLIFIFQCIQIFVWRFSELYRKTVVASVRCVRHIKEPKFQISQTFAACMMPSSASSTAGRLGFAILPTRTARPKGGTLRRDNFAGFFFAGIIPNRAYVSPLKEWRTPRFFIFICSKFKVYFHLSIQYSSS